MLRRTLLLVLLCALTAGAAPPHPFGWDDLFAMVRLSDPRPSPDGKWVLYARRQFDVAANKSTTRLALIPRAGGREKLLPVGGNGRWLADGSVLFLSEGKVKKWRQGKVTTVLELPVEVEGFEPAPDGQELLFWARVYPGLRTLHDTKVRWLARQKDKARGQVYDSLFVRHWDTFQDGRRLHPFRLKPGQKSPQDLLAGIQAEASGEGEWSPDGKRIAFSAKPLAGEAWTTNSEVYIVEEGHTLNRTADNPAWDGGARFAPDGRTLAYLAMQKPGFESDRQQIVLLDLATGSRRPLAPTWDRSVWELAWAPDGRSLYAVAEENARAKIFRVDASSGQVAPLVEEGSNQDPRPASDGELIYLHSSMTRPAELYAAGRQLSRVNPLDRIQMSQPEEFWVDHDGFRVHGWVLKPVPFQEGRKYPVAMLIHGGPQGSWTDSFGYRWNPQFFAGAGYAVVMVDPRGSTGYGMAFQNANRNDWGPGPYSDLMAGLNQALRQYPFLDQDRMAALGASYGGYMINWIEGQDHPFRCLVDHDGLFDTLSAGYDTDELWFPEWEMGGPPWERREVYRRNSPEQFVERWKTPMLIIHGARDYRVLEGQGLSTFNALQRRGVPSQLLYFPDENHWVLKPQNSRLWHRTVKAWLDRWT